MVSHSNGNGMHKRGANGHATGAARLRRDVKGDDKTKTDHSRWRLEDDRGCQIWHYLETEEECERWPQSKADKYFLGMDTVSSQVPY